MASGSRKMKPFNVLLELDVVQALLFVAALLTRLWRLDHPNAVVFDEIQYGRYASYYLKQSFFFDSSPPLGKMLIAALGYLSGYDGEFDFKSIGEEYGTAMPYTWMRLLPAFLGSFIVPIAYQIMVELRCSVWAAALAATLLLIDNSLIVQSRLLMGDILLLFFITFATLSYLKFKKCNKSRPFSFVWWMWLLLTGISFACSILTKYAAVLTVLFLIILVFRDLWKMLPDKSILQRTLVHHCIARLCLLLVLPLVIYVSVFRLHVTILSNSGPHDDIMTSQFQASLKGGLQAVTMGQPLEIAYGSQITLRNTHASSACWLHSHKDVYPLRYEDGRGSSHQQQVTCYNFKDVNNWWIVKHPERESLVVDDPIRPVSHGDIVELVHGTTGRYLNSHDVAAPMSPNNQEVTCYMNYNISMFPQTSWRVEIISESQDPHTWKTIVSKVRLIHTNSSQALRLSGKHLPKWGHLQLEVVADRIHVQDSTVWNVEEHKYVRDTEKQESNFENPVAINHITELGPWQKFAELQLKMWMSNQDVNLEHRYSSGPLEWPLVSRNIAYWVHPTSRAQIHFVGNPLVWCSGAVALLVCAGLLLFYLLRRRRQCYDIETGIWEQFQDVCELLLAGYLVNYLPYFAVDRTMFIYQYLPALFFKLCLLAFVVDHIHTFLWSRAVQSVFLMLVAVWLTLLVNMSISLLPITYGLKELTVDELLSLNWSGSWDLLKIA